MYKHCKVTPAVSSATLKQNYGSGLEKVNRASERQSACWTISKKTIRGSKCYLDPI